MSARSRLGWLAAALAALAVGNAGAQSVPERGSLLVASDDLPDPNFAGTVVLLLHIGDEGALGLILNRATWVEPGRVLPDAKGLAGYKGHLYVGGPVGPTGIVALFRSPQGPPTADAQPILDDVYAASGLDMIESLAAQAHDAKTLRIYVGHAIWSPGQLEHEIAAGGWHVLPGHAELVFDENPGTLWDRLRAEPPNQQFSAALERAPDALRLLR